MRIMKSTRMLALAVVAALSPAWAGEWMTDWDAAAKKAAEEKKALLVDFTGSDWCHFCIQLRRNVLDKPEFDAYAKDKFVPLEVDVPEKPRFSKEQLQRNEALVEKFGISGFPTLLVMTPEGVVLGGFSGYRDMAGTQKELDEALVNVHKVQESASLPAAERVKVLTEILNSLDEDVAECAESLRDAIMQADAADTTGLRRRKAALEQKQWLVSAAEQCTLQEGVAGLTSILRMLEEKDAEFLPENRENAVILKMSVMFLLAESKEDLECMKSVITADLEKPAAADMPATRKQEILQTLEQFMASPEDTLKKAAENRAGIEERRAAAKAAAAES